LAKAKLADAHFNMRWQGMARLDLSQSFLFAAGIGGGQVTPGETWV
jgi:hypothetical protein